MCEETTHRSQVRTPWKTCSMVSAFLGLDLSRALGLGPYKPWKLTWNLKITLLRRKSIFQTFIFGFHVCFRGCIVFGGLLVVLMVGRDMQKWWWSSRVVYKDVDKTFQLLYDDYHSEGGGLKRCQVFLTLKLGKWFNLTDAFQTGWHHQLALIGGVFRHVFILWHFCFV